MKASNHTVSSNDEIHARISEIDEIAPPIGKRYSNWLSRSDKSFKYWTFFEASGYHLLPFAGGLADQPEWLLKDFEVFIDLTTYFELWAERDRLSRRLSNV